MANGIVTGNESVLVQSRENANSSVSIQFQKVFVMEAGVKDERVLSRTYTFKEYVARMPFKMAKKLVEKDPEKYIIIEAIEEGNEALDKQIKEFNDATSKLSVSFKCKICGQVFASIANLQRHKQTKHPEEYAKEKAEKAFKGKKKAIETR
jgi:hypothetical protein